jgi:hypothetical protein
MIIVHVWESAWLSYLPVGQAGSPGHAAIQVGSTYVSFWPGAETGTLKWSGYKTKTLAEDIAYYKKNKQKHWFRTIPDDGNGEGLNEAAMIARWEEIKKSNPDYTKKFQCSHVVNELLIAGGCRKYAPPHIATWTSWVIYAVSPSDVKDYTETLIRAIKRARKG